MRSHLARFGMLRGVFASFAEVEHAITAGELSVHAHVVVRTNAGILSTIAGRCLVMARLPKEVPCALCNVPLERRILDSVLREVVKVAGDLRGVALARALEALGSRIATEIGLSFAMEHFAPPEAKRALVEEGFEQVALAEKRYEDGEITDGERYGRVLDVWAGITEKVGREASRQAAIVRHVDPDLGKLSDFASPHLLYHVTSSGACGGPAEFRALTAMIGPAEKPNGEVLEMPILECLGEGLSPYSMFALATEARKRQVDVLARAPDNERLAKALYRALGHVRITAHDCGALGSLPLGSLDDLGRRHASLRERVEGRFHGETGKLLSGDALRQLIATDPISIPIRSPIFCEAPDGICTACYGAESGATPHALDVGPRAAHALSEAFERVRDLRIVIGGHNRIEAGSCGLVAPTSGRVALRPSTPDAVAVQASGEAMVMADEIRVAVVDWLGIEIPCGTLIRGACLLVRHAEQVDEGQNLAEWDPFTRPVLADCDGRVYWEDVTPGRTLQLRDDDVTGLQHPRILIQGRFDDRPRIEIRSEDGSVVQTIPLQDNDELVARPGDRVSRGDRVGKRERTTVGWVGGWSRRELLDIFFQEKKSCQRLNDIDGFVSVTNEEKGRKILVVHPADEPSLGALRERRYTVRKSTYANVRDGERVIPGDPLFNIEGYPLEETLRVFGAAAAAAEAVDAIQLFYAKAGVPIGLRHVEVAVRAMMSWVTVTSQGAGPWFRGTVVSRAEFAACVDELKGKGLSPPTGERAIRGVHRIRRD